MSQVLAHRWVIDDGRLPPVPRQPLQVETSSVHEDVLVKMTEMGFNAADVRKAVLEDHHNQLTTTYYLLAHHHEMTEEESKKKAKAEAQPHHIPAHAASAAATTTAASASSAVADHPVKAVSGDRHCIIS
jgi:uncharacterized UBP type Zn finger protein